MEREVRHESRDAGGDSSRVAAGSSPAVYPVSETTMLRSFDEAIDQLRHVAQDVSALVERNGASLARTKAANNRLERLVAVNQTTLDRLVGAQPA